MDNEILKAACEWYTIMQEGDASEEQTQAWQNWLSQHPMHQQAWDKIHALEARMNPMDSMAATHVLQRPASSRRSLLKSVLFGLVAAGAAWEASQWNQRYSVNVTLRTLMAQLQTQKGQTRALVLEDESELWLNTDTRADLAYSKTERRIQLWVGEVMVQTAKDSMQPARPLSVETIHGQMVAKGTRFSVRMESGETTLAVFDGAVEVTLNNSQQRQLVNANQQVTFNADTIDDLVQAQPFRSAWIHSILAVDDWVLPMALAELSRYHSDTVTFHPSFANQRLVGTYPTNDLGRALASMAKVMDASLEQKAPNHWHFNTSTTLLRQP